MSYYTNNRNQQRRPLSHRNGDQFEHYQKRQFQLSTVPLDERSKFKHLPEDIIGMISTFDRGSNLNATYSNTWNKLGPNGIHGAYVVTPGNVSAILLAIAEQAISDPVSFRIPIYAGSVQTRLSSLYLTSFDSLKALKIVFRPTDYVPRPTAPLFSRSLKRYIRSTDDLIEDAIKVLTGVDGDNDASQLQILDLDFSFFGVSLQSDAVKRIARLKDSRALQMLRLNLADCCLGICTSLDDTDAKCLATLKECKTLHTLHLNIQGGGSMHAEGVLAINELKNMPTLRTFSLNLKGQNYRYGAFGPIGIEALVDLSRSSGLETLELNFDNNRIGTAFIPYSSLSGLGNIPNLRTLYLSLDNNYLGNDGAATIADALQRAPVLHTLHLSLENNKIGDHGATQLALLAGNKALRTLNLNLQSNMIGETGAMALSQMQLFDLCINLHLNNIHTTRHTSEVDLVLAKPKKGFLGFYREW
jgi:hypothetical protein